MDLGSLVALALALVLDRQRQQPPRPEVPCLVAVVGTPVEHLEVASCPSAAYLVAVRSQTAEEEEGPHQVEAHLVAEAVGHLGAVAPKVVAVRHPTAGAENQAEAGRAVGRPWLPTEAARRQRC